MPLYLKFLNKKKAKDIDFFPPKNAKFWEGLDEPELPKDNFWPIVAALLIGSLITNAVWWFIIKYLF